MTRRFPAVRLISLLLLTIIFFPGFKEISKRSKESLPNVIIIFIDDMGYGDPECYGGIPYHTPNINRLAAEGMRFTNFYAAQGVCSASRAALLTGCYPNRVGISGALFPSSKIALDPSEETIAEVLKKKGYATAAFGKWHLGDKPPFLPLQQGFDEYLGLPYSNDMWPVDYDGTPVKDPQNNKSKYPPLPLLDGNEKIKTIQTLEDQGELTSMYTRRAVNFIKTHSGKPFFLYMPHSMVHVPIAVSPAFKGKSGAGLFGDVVMEVDWSVGEILKTVREEGLEDNTLIVFTSDNGPWLTFGNHAGSSGGFREGKGTAWEGGVRIPCIMKWTGRIPGGTVANQIGAMMDLLPTIAGLAGAPLPSRKIDGKDISSIWKDPGLPGPRDEFAYYYDRNSLKGIRKGDWKLVLPCISQTYLTYAPGKDGYPGGYATDSVHLALYNLAHDPGETHDLKDVFPEKMKELMAIADKYRGDLGDDLTHQDGNGRRKPAEVVR